MPIITSRDRLQVSCRIGKDSGRAKETPCRDWSTQAQRDDTVKREYAETRYAENTLIWIACYMVRYKVRQSYEKICREGEMHGKFGHVATACHALRYCVRSPVRLRSARNA